MGKDSTFNKRTTENIHKLYYLAMQYPDKDIVGLSELFQTPPIEFNAAAWGARDLGHITIEDDKSVKVHDTPKGFKWNFGELVEHLMDIIPYVVAQVNKDEADIEENYFGNWTAGFPVHDVMIATKRLLEEGLLASYEIKDVIEHKPNRKQRREGAKKETIEEIYVFYTLPENADKRWGEKQFKDAKKLAEDNENSV